MKKCAYCGKVDEKSKDSRLPRGWKRQGDLLICKTCNGELYHLRAVTIPITGPLNPDDWPALRNALKNSWGDSTRLANWLVSEYFKFEGRVRKPEDEKLWKSQNPYLYPHARSVCPNLSSQSVVALINTVSQKYNAERFKVIWLGSASLANYRYPVPLPIPAQAWKVRYFSKDEKLPVLSVPINGVRFELKLRAGHEFRRQMDSIALLIDGEAFACQADIYQEPARNGDHRNGVHDGQFNRIMVKLVMRIPIQQKPVATKVLRLRRGLNSLLVAEVDGRDPWLLHCDHVRDWIVGHKVRRQRIADDLKFERRSTKTGWPTQSEYLQAICAKQNHRLDTFCHTAGKLVVEFARRQNCGTIDYDDAENDYMPDFPWFKLWELIGQKSRERGIAARKSESARDASK